jgi:hypothetical protein
MRLAARFVAENLRLGAPRRSLRGGSPRALELWSMTVRMAGSRPGMRPSGLTKTRRAGELLRDRARRLAPSRGSRAPRRSGAQHTRARQPFEPLTDGAQVLVLARRTEAPAELVEVGGDDGGGEGREGRAPASRTNRRFGDGAPVRQRGCGIGDAGRDELERMERRALARPRDERGSAALRHPSSVQYSWRSRRFSAASRGCRGGASEVRGELRNCRLLPHKE